jgi:ABC-type glycerol-3-phosphate transport system substrate-binding protein
MKANPFQLAVLAVCVIAGLVALFVFSTYKGTPSETASVGSVKIWGTLDRQSFNAFLASVKEFNDAYQGITYTHVDENVFTQTLADALSTGKGPDVILVSQDLVLANRDRITPVPLTSLSERTVRSNYVSLASTFMSPNGMYGVPFALDPLVLYFNTTHLNNANIALPPNTWDALLQMTPTLTKISSDQRITRSAIALGEMTNIEHASDIISMLLLQSGAKMTELKNSSYSGALTQGISGDNGAKSASAIQFFTQFSNPAKSVYSWNRSLPKAKASFVAGDTSFYVGYASEHAELSDLNPNLLFDMTGLPQPGGSNTRISYAKGYVFAFPKLGTNVAGAYTAAVALSSLTNAAYVTPSLSLVPSIKAGLVAPEGDVFAPIYFKEALTATNWLSPEPLETDAIFGTMISSIVSGRTDIPTALKTANDTLSNSLK